MKATFIFKGGRGSGNFGHSGRPGKVGGSGPGGKIKWLPPGQRVWQGKQIKGQKTITKLQTGTIGETLAAQALEDKFGVPFSSLNEGINNAPIDIAGDSRAVEVKTGVATNGITAQHWRATIGQPGKQEAALIAQMTKPEKRAHNIYKSQQILARKNEMLSAMSEIAGVEMKPATIGIILSPDGKRGDVFFIPGFHLRITWRDGAIEENYLGTYGND